MCQDAVSWAGQIEQLVSRQLALVFGIDRGLIIVQTLLCFMLLLYNTQVVQNG